MDGVAREGFTEKLTWELKHEKEERNRAGERGGEGPSSQFRGAASTTLW